MSVERWAGIVFESVHHTFQGTDLFTILSLSIFESISIF